MELVRQHKGIATVHVTEGELRALNNGLNEALEALDEWEFETRMGISPEGTSSLMADLRAIIRALT